MPASRGTTKWTGGRSGRRDLRGIGERLEADGRLDSLGEDDEFAQQPVVE